MLLQGLSWPRCAGGTGRGFGHSRLHPNRAQGPVFIASGKGTVEAPGYLLSSADVREVIEVFPGVPGSRECSEEFLVVCALHSGSVSSPWSVLQHRTPGIAGTAWLPHRDSRITPITRSFAASRNALCSHCFSLWFSWIALEKRSGSQIPVVSLFVFVPG